MSVIEITSKAQFDELIKSHPYVALQAHATWCGPCKAISPIYTKNATEKLAPEGAADKLAFAKFDTDDVPDLAFELGIRSIPAFFFFENQDKADSLTGANPTALKARIDKMSEAANKNGFSTTENF
ncbi:hypothetical protein ACO1O0_007688 [Amphichorda felina]